MGGPARRAGHASSRAFEDAVRVARNAGTPDTEIAHVIGYSVPMLEAVAGKRR
jgi:hypothetical protein